MNMKKIFKHYLKTSERLERYERCNKINKNWKPIRSSKRVRQVSVGLRGRDTQRVENASESVVTSTAFKI